jgi:plasmid replication initiation protein
MDSKKLTVYKSNRVVEAAYKLNLNEQRVILACIGQVNSVEELLRTDEFTLSAKGFAKLYGVTEDNVYGELLEVAKNLYQRSLTIYNPYPDRPKLEKLETRWISSIGYMPEEGKIVLTFAQHLLPYLSQLKGGFTKYKLEHVSKMTCIYAIRLYELLVQWQGAGKREIELDWLKRQFQLDSSYDRMDNLKARVLNPAVADINTHSNLTVAWTQRKTGRRVTHLIFTFGEKNAAPKPPAKPKAAKEPRIGGVSKSEIERQARPGESYADAAARISAARQGE